MGRAPEFILNYDDLLNMLDDLIREPGPWWDGFYEDRDKGIPFFVNAPDENLVEYFKAEKVKPGRVLELGSGPGRNAIYMAEQGCEVDAVDASEKALIWAKERADKKGLSINGLHQNIFELDISPNTYDFVYDSGCFHHIAPHRRMDYVELISKALKPGGLFGLNCFAAEVKDDLNGNEIPDRQVYKDWSLHGGLAYSKEKLIAIFQGYEVVSMRMMKDMNEDESLFGVPFMWTMLLRKN